MVEELLSPKKYVGLNRSEYDKGPSHHLVDRARTHGQADEAEGRTTNIEESRNSKFVDAYVVFWRFVAPKAFDLEKNQTKQFTYKHYRTLQVGVEKFDVVNACFIL